MARIYVRSKVGATAELVCAGDEPLALYRRDLRRKETRRKERELMKRYAAGELSRIATGANH